MTDSQTRYIATYRVVFSADDDMQARIITDHLQEQIAQDLDEDEGDSVDLTQVVSFGQPLNAQEVVDQLYKTRNLLLRTKLSVAYDLARELDKLAYVLANRTEETMDLSGYDWGKLLEVSYDVLQGKMPIE